MANRASTYDSSNGDVFVESGATPSSPITHNGPIHRYLAITGQSRSKFEAALEGSDPNAVTLFAAECSFREMQHLTDAVQRLADAVEDLAAAKRNF
jgi:hypothetical protein